MTMTSKDEIYKNIDYTLIYSKANEYLATTSVIEVFPYKVKAFVEEQSDIRLCTYSKAMTKFGIDVKSFGSESAVIQEYCGAHIIFYNQDEQPYRVRFSIMHEFGHYILGHKMNLDVNDPLYGIQELEANCFAAQMVMPEQILREAGKRGKMISIDYIKKSFKVSEEAAEKRKKTLATNNYEWKKRSEKEFDDIIIFRYGAFINRIAPKRIDYIDYDYEYQRQQERDMYLDTRTRWS